MKKIIESLISFYKEPFLKLVVYVDGSGYIGAINGKRLFEFDDLAKFEAHLTMRAADEKAVAWLDPVSGSASSKQGNGYTVPLFRR